MKNINPTRKVEKLVKAKKCRDIVSECRDIILIEPAKAMSQQVELYRNKYQVELKPEMKIVTTSHNSVAT